ncbi:unnamed protein product [Orchesella dallaii]|uniref:Uncharacterized protein n=1 Tax=Orchesella dallaii TaxID=48710 RepID=A0ABP1PY11_9HEXA
MKRNHCVLVLHHPSYYTYVPGPVTGNKDWINMLPFLNANFYIYQKMQGIEMMIDWKNISGTDDTNREERMTQLRGLFTEILNAAHQTPNQRFGRFSIVRRNDSEILSLELAEIH